MGEPLAPRDRYSGSSNSRGWGATLHLPQTAIPIDVGKEDERGRREQSDPPRTGTRPANAVIETAGGEGAEQSQEEKEDEDDDDNGRDGDPDSGNSGA